jgi:hypothetical protein
MVEIFKKLRAPLLVSEEPVVMILYMNDDDEVDHTYFFIQNTDKNLLRQMYPLYDFVNEGVEISLTDHLLCIEFTDPTSSQVDSLSSPDPGVNYFFTEIFSDGIEVVTNCGLSLIDKYFEELNAQTNSDHDSQTLFDDSSQSDQDSRTLVDEVSTTSRFLDSDVSSEASSEMSFHQQRTEIVFSDLNPSSTLLKDVPLGIRLFNCLIRGRKNG